MPYDPTGYVSHEDELHRSQTWKRWCRVATTGNITLSGNQTIDGIATATGDRVLVKANTSGSQNGIWVSAAGAWTRAFDMDQDGTTSVVGKEIVGAVIHVTEGTVNAGTFWQCTNTGTPILGTTALTFTQVAAASGTVTSVGLTVPAEFSVAGSPVTTSGTLAVTKATQAANLVYAGPTSGSAAVPTFRAIVAADIPSTVGYHEVVMVTGSSPPDPVLNSAGDDWVYSS